MLVSKDSTKSTIILLFLLTFNDKPINLKTFSIKFFTVWHCWSQQRLNRFILKTCWNSRGSNDLASSLQFGIYTYIHFLGCLITATKFLRQLNLRSGKSRLLITAAFKLTHFKTCWNSSGSNNLAQYKFFYSLESLFWNIYIHFLRWFITATEFPRQLNLRSGMSRTHWQLNDSCLNWKENRGVIPTTVTNYSFHMDGSKSLKQNWWFIYPLSERKFPLNFLINLLSIRPIL